MIQMNIYEKYSANPQTQNPNQLDMFHHLHWLEDCRGEN